LIYLFISKNDLSKLSSYVFELPLRFAALIGTNRELLEEVLDCKVVADVQCVHPKVKPDWAPVELFLEC